MSTICLDFGTAWCKAAQYLGTPGQAFAAEAVRVLPLNGAEGAVLATALRVHGDRLLLGAQALAHDAGAQDGQGAKGAPYLSFKTLLSAPDLTRVLQMRAPARYDPSAGFTQRELVIAFLAFALHRVRAALGLAGAEAMRPFRFTYPAWGLGQDRRGELGALFNEAACLAQIMGDAFGDNAGLRLASLRDGLQAAKERAVPVAVGAVFEAGAAACSRMLLEPDQAQAVMVVDIGAGTTDFGAFTYRQGQMAEIRQARKTIDLAGYTVDNALLNLLIERARHVKGATAQGVLWRELSPQIRRFKEALFTQGRAALRCAGVVVQVQAADLERHVGYRAFVEAVTSAFVDSLEGAQAGANDGALAHGLIVVLSGGGAGLPFLTKMIARARPKKWGKLRISAAPLRPAWCEAPCFEGQLLPVFPQMCVAIGGAMAGEHLVSPCVDLPHVAAL